MCLPFVFVRQRLRAHHRSRTGRGHMRMPFVFAGQRFRRMTDLIQELPESRLNFGLRTFPG